MSSLKRAAACVLTVPLALAALGSCDDGATAPSVGSVSLSPGNLTLAVAENQTATAAVRAEDGTTLTGRLVSWSSSSTSVATVSPTDSTGNRARITAVAPGSATITATADGVSAQLSVTVVPRAGTVTVVTATTGSHPDEDGYTLDVAAGDSAWTVTVAGNDTVAIEAVPEGDAAVSLSELALNCYPDGETDRTVSVVHQQGSTVTFEVECKVPVASIDVEPAEINVGIGDTLIISAFARDSAGNVLVDRPVRWSASDTSVVVVEPIDDVDTGANPDPSRVAAPDDAPEPTGQALAIGRTEGSATVTAESEGSIYDAPSRAYPAGQVAVELYVTGESGGGTRVAVSFGDQTRSLRLDNDLNRINVTFFYQPAGSYELDVAGGFESCYLNPEPPVAVVVEEDSEQRIRIDFVCPDDGVVGVYTTTTGEDQPTEPYTAWVGQQSTSLPTDGGHLFEDVPTGTHAVRLTDVPTNCSGPEDTEVTFPLDEPNYEYETVQELDLNPYYTEEFFFELECTARPGRGTRVIAGTKTTYVVRKDGDVSATGWNDHGQLGLGHIDDRNRFTSAHNWEFDEDFEFLLADIVGGHRSTMARYEDGSVSGAGDNSTGWMGDGSNHSINDMPTWMDIDDVLSADLADQTACVTKSNAELWCAGSGEWGTNGQWTDRNTFGPLGVPWPAGADVRLDGGTTVWAAIARDAVAGAGSGASSPGGLLADASPGTVYTWGQNGVGQLGTGSDDAHSLTPVAVDGEYVDVSAGLNHVCAVGTDGQVYCWGFNNKGQLGDGTTTDRATPTPVAGDATFAAVSAGAWLHSCALTTDGVAYCWGDNRFGQLGDGTTTDRLEPTPVAGGLTFAMISAGWTHSCGVTTADDVYCWGHNDKGQLGDGTNTDRSEPTAGTFEEP